MRQAIMTQPGKIEVKNNLDIPDIQDHEVLIKVSHIGVCGSDIHVNHGLHPFTKYPVIQGHEFSGHVIKIGASVSNKMIQLNTLVTALPQITCGQCPPCKRGDFNICDELKVRGFQAPGVAQDYVALPEDMIIALPENMKPEVGAFVEPVSVAVHAVNKAGDLKGKNVLVTGAGTIGNLIAQAVKAKGGKVLISDVSDYRLEMANACGIEHSVNPLKQSMTKQISQAFGDNGFDVAFEAAGVDSALNDAIQHIAKGGKVIVVAVYGEPPKVDMSIIGDRELTVKGTLMYKHEDYRNAVQMLEKEDINVQSLITKTFQFENYLDAYEYIDEYSDTTMKIMIGL